MRPRRVLFLLSRVLGGRTFSGYVLQASGHLGVEADFVYLDESDYAAYGPRLPAWQRAAGLLIGSSILRLKLRERPPRPYDAVFLQSFEILPALSHFDPGIPAVLAHDSTNVISYRLIRQAAGTPAAVLACSIKSRLMTPAYRPWLRRVRAFVPRTRWCARSLVRDFGVPPERIRVAPAGLDLDRWSPAPRPPRAKPVLLFVGNDFARKGGPFLVDLFSARYADRASLRIVSNDPALRERRWPPGVEILRGLDHGNSDALIAVYRDADIFVFPTRKEHLGQAAVEACAVGLPIVATNVGGVGESVRSGVNGFRVPYAAGESAWAAALDALLDSPDLRARMGSASRRLAEAELGAATLIARMRSAFALLDQEADGAPATSASRPRTPVRTPETFPSGRP